jgi:glycosyltransferase involved in cell wall biosynthesis
MRVLLTSEARFERTPDGVIWGPAAYGRALWSRYLEVFSAVVVAARVADVRTVMPGSIEASLPEVQFCALPSYAGLSGFARSLRVVRDGVARALQTCPATIVRAPSPIAFLTGRAVVAAGRLYGAEIVGDPNQVFSPGAFRHPFRSPLRRLATAAQKRLSRDAAAVLFVTSEALQRQYPTRGRTYAASDAALDDSAFAGGHPREWTRPGPFRLVTVGALDQPYKGTAYLFSAIRELRRRGAPVKLCVVGAGRLMAALQGQSRKLGIQVDVEFRGQLDRRGVREALDEAHLFVLPSLTEGLPRALLEAMARGLPAVATEVGGVPELLPPTCLVPPGHALALADRIERLMADDAGRGRLGEENRRQARRHHERLHMAVRRDFLRTIREASAPAGREIRCA